MLDSVRNLRISRIELRQRLPERECAWLIGRLRAHRDVATARCSGDERRLTIEYDADRLGRGDLVDLLRDCGVRVASLNAGRG